MEKFDFCDKHLENEVTATSSKSTPFKPIRRSLRQLMVRNENDYIKHVKLHRKKINYMKALGALRKGRNGVGPQLMIKV